MTQAWKTLLFCDALAVLACVRPPVVLAADGPAELEARREESRRNYERLAAEAALSRDRLVALTSEVAAIRKDNASLTAALIQAAKTEKKLAGDIASIEERLEGLGARQDDVRQSLAERSDVLAEVLGALQRMGLNPPPAILVTPEDALSSVRSAILLGAVVPDLSAETRALVDDLDELARVARTIESERERLVAAVAAQVEEKGRLSLLLEEKRLLQDRSEAELTAEALRAEALARQAGSVQELIASLESELDSARKAAEKAGIAEEDRRRRLAEAGNRPVPEANRLVGQIPFEALKGQLLPPAAGRATGRFGEDDGLGGTRQGDTVATQSGAIVTAPADGGVLYAGPFRSYGQLLILNAGDGYHVVLAGLGRIDVALGQPVLAGEPVGAMGEARLASAGASPVGSAAPELYVEFRKEGKPVDPSSWWTDRSSGRTGNGT